ncbi:G protein-activated inward rectifier potassium channel 3-like [Osmerus mordax]|uniref:G protein-activated inward rectifier potassium channel 3-like n=1 Tax=Osmerus mordax TaxID=8014 RepID=UPI00350FD30B
MPTGTTGPAPEGPPRARRLSVSSRPQSIMVVQSRSPGEGVSHQSNLLNTDTEAPLSPLPLPDIMFGEPFLLPTLTRRHKSTTDIAYSPQRGYFRSHRPSIHVPTEAELALFRRCSLREPNGLPRCCPGHALSVPNMTSIGPLRSPGPSPQRGSLPAPSRSIVSSPVRELERLAKARSKLQETECAQTPTLPPEAREQLRYVTKDGKCRVNLCHIAERGRFLSDIFTSFVDLQYRWFLFVFMMCYAVTWFWFAALYFLDAFLRGDLDPPPNSHRDVAYGQERCYQGVDDFVSALLFSVETQRTIGYGSCTVSPACHEGVALVMTQCIVGSMIDALMVGCMFVKISRPKKRAETLLFSRTCVISNRDDQLCLMFRLGDLRESHMVDAKVRAKLIKSRQTAEGEFLPLEQSEIDLGYDSGSDRLFLVEPQVIQHTIDSSSPFWELDPGQLRKQQFEIIVILEGIVEATGMMCQAKTSYIETEIEWGARFEPCMTLEKGSFRVDLRRFHSTYKVPLPQCSASEAQQVQTLGDCELRDASRTSGDWEPWGEAEGEAKRDWEREREREGEGQAASLRHGGFTIDNIQEERFSELNEGEGRSIPCDLGGYTTTV